MSELTLRPADLGDPQVQALVLAHVTDLRGASPPGTSFALDASGLAEPTVSVWTAWDGDRLAGMGALKELDPRAGELKSMRTHPDHLRRGVAARLLEHLIELARARGYQRLSLETGTGLSFAPALALYRRRGFGDGPPFGDYQASEHNQFLHLELAPPG